MEVGNLAILGPSFPEEMRTCVSGQFCRLTGLLGEGLLAESSEILVAETCGTAAVISGFVQPTQTLQQNLLLEASWAAVTAAGGRYRLCWCSPTQGNHTDASGASECEVASNFRIDMGGLTVLGPQLGQDRTCISGRTCFVDGILGEGLLETDSVLVLETCGFDEVVPRFSGSGFFTNISRSGASVSWGGTPNTAAGGSYRLCWCSADFACSVPNDFQVDFGSLVLLGVAPLGQAATCVVGRACPSFWTFGPAAIGDAIALDTCGADLAVAPSHVRSNITGLDVLEPGAVGSWRLCWCASWPSNTTDGTNRTECQNMLEYVVDVGELTILGPLPSNGHTCVSGLPCLADGLLGLDLTASDAFVVLATCGTAATPARFPNSAFAVFDIMTGTLQWDGNSSLTAVTAAGGEYRLCWCRPLSRVDCLAPTDFRSDLGIVTVLGPSPLQQDKTCISGVACALGSFTGNLLSSEDGLKVMKDCGSSEGIVAGIPPLELGNSSYVLLASGGSYRICWCTPPSRAFAAGLPSWDTRDGCFLAEDFVVDVGALTVLGPNQDHVRTCVAGAVCSSALQGLGITSVDYTLQILDTCSALIAELGRVEGTNGSVPLFFDKVKAAGGSYRLCWCGLNACNEMVDVGSVFLLGVAPLHQDRTCVAGHACRLEGIMSYGNLDVNHLMILQTCNVAQGIGITDVAAVTQNDASQSKAWILDEVTLPGGGYRMCWCGSIGSTNSTQNQTVDCRRVTGSQVDFGELLVMGPSSIVDLTCVSGQACSVDGLLGQHLSSSDSLTILDTCGSIPSDRFQGIPQHGLAVTVAASGSAANWGFSIPLTGPGGFYRLCWCAAGFSCASSKDFSMEIGSLSLRGPSPVAQDRTCVAGYTCNVALDGCDMNPHVVEAVTAFRLALDPSNAESANLSAFDVYYTSLESLNVSEANLAGSCSISNTSSSVSAGNGLSWYSCFWQPAITASRWLVVLQSDASLRLYEAEFLGRNGWTAIALMAGVSGITGNPSTLSDGVLSSWALASSGSELGFDALQPDLVLLADTCAVDFISFPSNLVWGPVSLSPYQADVLTAQGGRYRLCWCARGFSCSFMQDFSVDAGQLTVVGPKKVFNTCIAGTSCTIELDGQHLSDESQVLVLHTCAVEDARVWKLTDLGAWQHLSGAATFASTGIVTSAAGTYKLCWCSGLSACSTASDFSVEAGDLWVMGVAPLVQDHTCVSGQSCVVDHLSGLGLSKDQIMVLETCGTNSLLYRGLDASEVTNGSTAILTWLDDLTAPGGQYRLCWCSARDGCPFPADFQVDFGQFTIIGPSPLLQTWTCISGQACRLDGITGHGTGTSAEFVIMDTCGASDSQILFYDSPLASTAHSWEDFVLSLPGAYYRMCWCAASTYPCSVADNFKVDFGRLLVVGPYPLMQDRTCVAGSSCEVDGFTGVGLSSSDLLVIRDTCADRHSRVGLGALMSLTLPAGSAYVSAEGSSNNSVVFHTLSASGGQYRLCWTSWKALQLEISRASNNSENDTAATADEILDFLGGCNDTLGGNRTCAFLQMPGRMTQPANAMLDIGRLTLIGPAPLDHVRTDHTCVSGQPCTIDGIEGLHLTAHDRVAVLDTCGDQALPLLLGHLANAPYSTSVTWDSDFLVASGGVYQLCWCSGVFGCSLAEDFQVQAGALTLIGPAPMEQHRTCVSGQHCILEGFDVVLPTNSDSVIVLQTCGEVSSGQEPSMSRAVTDLGANGSRIDFGDAFFTASGGEYRLCWCSGNFGCSVPGDFRVQLGLLKIMGMAPLNQDRTCISGQTCVVHGLQGEGLSTSARVMVLNSCGTVSPASNLVLNGVAEAVEDQGKTMTWGSTLPASPGGNYRLCWCLDQEEGNSSDEGIGSHQGNSSDWPDRCRTPADFVQDAGMMTIVGVAPLNQQYTCISGSVCSLRGISGEGLLADDMVLVLATCGSGKPPEGFPIAVDNASLPTRRMSGTKYNIHWDAAAVTSAGGMYRLCWCSYFAHCSTANDFRVDMGSLTLAGPSPLRQTLTCVSGQSCVLPVISVIPADLDRGEVAVLASCSHFTSWVPLGFPDRGQLLSVPSLPITAPGGQYTLCWNPARENTTIAAEIGEFQTQPGP